MARMEKQKMTEWKDLIKKINKTQPNIGSLELEAIEIDIVDTLTVLGQKNSGKSYFLSYLANLYPRVVLYDTRWERYTGKSKEKISVKAFKMPDKWVIASDMAKLKTHVLRNKTHIIYHPKPLIPGKRSIKEQVDEFSEICQFLFEWGDYTLFVDECDNYCDTHHIPDGFKNLLEYGRHSNSGTIAATRRLQHLNPRIPRLSSYLIIFRLSGKDFKYISEYVTEPDEYHKSEFFDAWKKELTGLEDRYFYIFDGKELKKFSPVEEIK